MLLWSFLGVAIVADVFMAAIERITSSEKKVIMTVKGVQKPYFVRVWNPTIANLTLMALGSSAPEILLSSLEVVFNGMYMGDLGPSTIVGSAAFNLLKAGPATLFSQHPLSQSVRQWSWRFICS